MDYKKAYKEALERAKKFANSNYRQERYTVEEIFPELKESEDEKWRNWLIGHLKGYINQTDNKYAEVCKKAIEWLEKQGKNNPAYNEDDERIRKALLEYFGEQCDMSNWNGVYGYEVYAWLEKQKCNKTYYDPYKATVESIAEMCKRYSTSTDLHDFYDNVKVKCKDAMEYNKIWLEKQGEKMSDQRHGILDKLIEADNIYQMAMNDAMVEEAKNKAIEALSKLGISKLLWLDKQGEQSKQQLYDIIIALWDLLDKIDTFADLKINDTDPNNPFRKIEHLTQERHRFVKSDGYNLFIDDLMITNEKMEKQGEQKPNFCHHEVDLSDCSEEYRKAYYDGWNNCNQQYVQLEAEQKTAWSEEDEKMLEDTISCLSAYQSPDISKGLCYQEQIDWLKSIKNRVQLWPKQEETKWSKEDEKMFESALWHVKNSCGNGGKDSGEFEV